MTETLEAPIRRVDMPMVYRHLGDKRFPLALPRAISLQILHPSNAAGLVQHVATGLWVHKQRSVSQMVYIAYTNRDMRSAIRFAHEHVKGVDEHGNRYHSLNPELFYFQHATYLDALFTSVELFHKPLSEAEKDELYLQTCLWYGKYGISDRSMPADRGSFNEYFEDQISRLEMSENAARLREETLNPRSWIPSKVPAPALRAMLHPRAAELLDVKVTDGDQRALRSFARKVKLQAALTPSPYHLIPSARHDPDE